MAFDICTVFLASQFKNYVDQLERDQRRVPREIVDLKIVTPEEG